MQQPITALRLATDGPADTQAVAAALASAVREGDLLVLTGDLGAGKTCFTQGLGRGLGIEDRITSPTFTLANRYRGRLTLNHLDVYRLNSVAESMDLGLTELLDDGVTVIEWGDRIDEVLPLDHLLVALRYRDSADGGERADVAWDDPEMNRREIHLTAVAGADSSWSDRDLPGLLSRWVVS